MMKRYFFQATKQLYALHAQRFGNKHEANLTRLREAMGTVQHHDAITGTEKQPVSFDYMRLLSRGIEDAEKPLGAIIRYKHVNLATLFIFEILIAAITNNLCSYICTEQKDREIFLGSVVKLTQYYWDPRKITKECLFQRFSQHG